MKKICDESVTFLELFNAATHVSIIATDREGLITAFNPGAQNMLGYKAEEVVGRLTPASFHLSSEISDHGSRISSFLGRPVEGFDIFVAVAREQSFETREWTYVRKDGTLLTVNLTVTGIADGRGGYSGYLGIAVDVTERVRAVSALKESESRLKFFVEHTPAAVAMLDRDMRYILVSRRWMTDYGLNDIDIIGHSHYEVFPTIPDRWKEFHKLCLAGQVLSSDEDLFVREDGRKDFLRWEIHPWSNDFGRIGGIIMFTEVITARLQAERRVRQSEAQLRAILDTAVDGIITMGPDGAILTLNDAAARIFGYEREELAGRDVAVIMPEPYKSQHAAYVRSYLQTHEPRIIGRGGREVPGLRKDGAIVPIELAVSQVQVEGTPMFTAILRDIGERKKSQEALMTAYRLLAANQERLDADIQAAAMIQQVFLPHASPKMTGWDIAWRFKPSSRLAGDLFNVVALDQEHVGIFILDVSGHGVPSALVGVSVHQALRPGMGIVSRSDGQGGMVVATPSEVMKRLEQEYPMERFDKYFTIFYLVLNHRNGRIVYTCGGHPPALVARRGGRLEQLGEGGAPIGMGVMLQHAEGRTSLLPGDALLLYTDGCFECVDVTGTPLGEERLESVFLDAADLSAEGILECLLEDMAAYVGDVPPDDDISILCLKRCPRVDQSEAL